MREFHGLTSSIRHSVACAIGPTVELEAGYMSWTVANAVLICESVMNEINESTEEVK